MKKTFALLWLLCLVLLCGCTVTSNRIYTVCKVDGDKSYCYNNAGEFFLVSGESFTKISAVGLKELPALSLDLSDGSYTFKEKLPGLYGGTLASVNHYLYRLCDGDVSSVSVSYRDWNNIESFVVNEEFKARVIFNIRGDVRIYFVDNYDNPIAPLYLNEE